MARKSNKLTWDEQWAVYFGLVARIKYKAKVHRNNPELGCNIDRNEAISALKKMRKVIPDCFPRSSLR